MATSIGNTGVTFPDSSTQNTAAVVSLGAHSGGNNQWWSVSRTINTWYQNTTGAPIGVYAYGQIGAGPVWNVGANTTSYVTLSMDDGDSGDSADYGWIVVPPDHYYRNTGVWANAKEMIATLNAPTPGYEADYDAFQSINSDAVAKVYFNSDGGMTHEQNSSIVDTGVDWYKPNTANIGSSYWLLIVSATGSGTFTSSGIGTRLALSTQRYIQVYNIAGAARYVTCQIWDAASAGNLMYTGVITLFADGGFGP